ncbi:unnamed protein product [Rotaria magnacalcarata]|uniref:Pleckstrin homology domain-containing family A member 8 n=3 Tax=Rotaria magnacalcarata TaxID=392030 RepID=A0A819G2J3_9BILA|nr:unnamed protein product [Rotaria magnacalcarata]
MEGKLFKWTNYYNGWQPRYFVLNETGVLSYYKSSELIHEGCKGSFLVPACEVKVHPHDPFRFDLIIPGEQFFCLKAKSQPERQRWLVALGTCKSRGTKSTTSTIISNNSNNNNNNFSHLNAVDHEIKIKVQELHLYETVLTQRIHAIKSIANDTPIPDIKKLDESTSMLSVTCDAFIHTLDECIKLATGNSSQSLLLLSPSSLTAISDDISILQQSFCSIDSTKLKNSTDTVLPKQNFFKTFFSELSYSFAELTSLKFEEIHSELFLSTCEQYINLIEKFNSKTFIPLRADANGNINKLKRKISNDPNKFQTLYSIVNDEIIAKTTKEKNSATDALLWLKSRTKHNTMGTCYSKRSACYDLTQNHHAITMCTLKSPGTPPATLRRFSSLRHSVKSFSSMAYQRRSFRTRPMTGIKQSPKTKHLCIIKYNESKEALV